MVLRTRQGLPTATEKGGMSLVTTDPAPMVDPSPMVTPGKMTTLPPIQQSLPMRTGWPNSTNLRRESTLTSWPAVKMLTLGPHWTRSPIRIKLVSRAVKLVGSDWDLSGRYPRRIDDLLEVDEAVAPDGNVGAVIRAERRLDEGARADVAHNLLQQLETNVDDLLVRD
ncbi:hypothetical protein BO94DRAFT_53924 [Aspergillus sclerotioniger CBS 115572]|uniref:Uncharacterized protein n=1 Tax=Aspergillus sclerotioniger CBS 115572 TaxID=1450535 RepID=A0A317WR09_9EURO|nr:hypothetical protein BO94DRAFT_53924 [Aspergillus sclerotioniger CBS 115572]PWY88873.1 hypothetical protein BO94DRAFT_53924 [Aspergillus sclerotioniger CBS 115572]